MPGLHDGVPFRGGLRKTYRGYARADRTKDRALPGRKAPSEIHVRNFYAAGSLAAHALAAACLSEIRIAEHRARIGFAEVVAEADAGDGSDSSQAWTA